MRGRGSTGDHDLAAIIESLLDDGETLLWWDKFSDRSIIGGFGRTLTLFALAVNGLILLLILLPSLWPAVNALSWLLVPLLLVDCVCLLFIMLYFAFGLTTGGVNAITTRRVMVADVHRKRIMRFVRLETLSAIRARRHKDNRGDLLFVRDPGGQAPPSALHPGKLSMQGVRQFDQVVALLREQTDVLDGDKSEDAR